MITCDTIKRGDIRAHLITLTDLANNTIGVSVTPVSSTTSYEFTLDASQLDTIYIFTGAGDDTVVIDAAISGIDFVIRGGVASIVCLLMLLVNTEAH